MIKRKYRQYLKLKQLIIYNKALLKEEGPMPGTIFFFFEYSPFLNYMRAFLFYWTTLFLLISFIIYRFVPEHESLVILLYIITFFSSLFYIGFIRIGI
jgi:hypothetical protein